MFLSVRTCRNIILDMSVTSVKISELKVNDLKRELKKRNVSCSGKKSDLVNKLKSAMDSSYLFNNDESSSTTTTTNYQDKKPNNNGNEKRCKKKNANYFSLINKINSLEEQIKLLSSFNKKLIRTIRSGNKPIETVAREARISQNVGDDITPEPASKPKNSHKKNKILILSDKTLGNLREKLTYALEEKFSITAIIKPNASFENIVEDIENLSKDFSKNDYIIVQGGLVNAKRGVGIARNVFPAINNACSRTNLLFISLPFWRDRYVLNGFIKRINDEIYKEIYMKPENSGTVKFLDINDTIRFDHFNYNPNITMKKQGVNLLMRMITKILNDEVFSHYKPDKIRNQYVLDGNLTYIIPCEIIGNENNLTVEDIVTYDLTSPEKASSSVPNRNKKKITDGSVLNNPQHPEENQFFRE